MIPQRNVTQFTQALSTVRQAAGRNGGTVSMRRACWHPPATNRNKRENYHVGVDSFRLSVRAGVRGAGRPLSASAVLPLLAGGGSPYSLKRPWWTCRQG